MDSSNHQAKSGKTASLIGQGNNLLKQGNFSESLRYFNDALIIEPNNNQAIIGQIKSLIDRGNYQLKTNYLTMHLEVSKRLLKLTVKTQKL